MAKVEQFALPEPVPLVRDGEAVVELRQNGELVGEINFSKIFTQWFSQIGIGRKQSHLKSV